MTPMQKQWAAAKERAKDAILLFRMGDFYELFADDAEKAAPILELTLTSRDGDIPMAGFPHHAAPAYIAKLVGLGHKVAVCDQLEDPKQAKGIVKRDITRIVTPGTVLEDDSLKPSQNNWLLALCANAQNGFGLAALDLSTGEFIETSASNPQNIIDEAAKLAPSEVLLSGQYWTKECLAELHRVTNQTKTCRFESMSPSAGDSAAKIIKTYVHETQGGAFDFLDEPKAYSIQGELIIDATSREHLDLDSLVKLFHITGTAMGARQMNRWISAPSTSIDEITRRQDQVQWFIDHPSERGSVRNALKHLYDLERLTVKLAASRINPRELGNMRDSLTHLPSLVATLGTSPENLTPNPSPLVERGPAARGLEDIHEQLQEALSENPPFALKDGGIFQKGYDALLDEYTEYATGGRDQIAQIEQREREATGIPSLKVKYTRVFGYYIEVTHTHLAKVPEHYKRKQTVAGGERFVTPELMRLEEMVSTADVRRLAREAELFEQLRTSLLPHTDRLFKTAAWIAEIDTFAAWAELAEMHRYVRPALLPATDLKLEITNGRHPVIEALLQKQGSRFIPNSVTLNSTDCQLALITGPNMAGKSTIMRQVALIQLLAQAGCFVPADSATLSLCDRIFTRVGASDDAQSGRSTFMVEMTETAHILNHSTAFSLVLLDEIGRGTSTFDGLSIAWAVAEHLHNQTKARTMFATHYHELTKLSESLNKMRNLQVAVSEKAGEIKFLYTLQEGAAERSYGIQVASLAGLPKRVLERASEVLESLEQEKPTPKVSKPKQVQLPLFIDPLRMALKGFDINASTPMQALSFVAGLKELD